jgi:hypothetical protein
MVLVNRAITDDQLPESELPISRTSLFVGIELVQWAGLLLH